MPIGGIIVIAIIVFIIYGIRYAINKAVDKTADAVGNAIRKKKNENNPPQTQNLADQYKDKGI